MEILITLLIAALAGLGVGSGGLFIVYLTLLAGVEQYTAQALNLWFYLFAAGAAMLFYLKNRRLPIKRLLWVCAFGTLGCLGGSRLASVAARGTLRTAFAGLMIVSGVLAFCKKERRE